MTNKPNKKNIDLKESFFAQELPNINSSNSNNMNTDKKGVSAQKILKIISTENSRKSADKNN